MVTNGHSCLTLVQLYCSLTANSNFVVALGADILAALIFAQMGNEAAAITMIEPSCYIFVCFGLLIVMRS